MKNHRMIIFLLTSIISCAGITYAVQDAVRIVPSTASQEDSRAQQQPVSDDVIDEAPLPANSEELAQRIAKNRLHNQGGADLTAMAPGIQVSEISCGVAGPLLPTEYASVIVIGKVTNLQPYLSEDKSYIYTEYAVQVEQYLKKDAEVLPMVGDKLIVDRPGGVLRLQNGYVIRYYSDSTGMARPLPIGERLVLFLRRNYDGAVLTLGPGFLLQNGKTYAIGQRIGQQGLVGDLPGVEKTLSQEDEFIIAVIRAIHNPPSPAFYSALEMNRKTIRNQ